jgi:hypothetical protein
MKRLLFALMLCLVPVVAQTATVTRSIHFSWSYTAEAEAEITGFIIYQLVGTDPEKAVISDIPKTARFATGPITYDNGRTNRFYIRAIDASDPLNIDRSDPSNTVKMVVAPGQFKKN